MNRQATNLVTWLYNPFGSNPPIINFHGVETLSAVYYFDLIIALSKISHFKQDLINQPIAWQIRIHDQEARYFHGVIVSYQLHHNKNSVVLKIKPTLYLLSKIIQSHLFKKQYLSDVISQILQPVHIHYQSHFSRINPSKKIDITQYQQSNLNFLSRLLRENNIFYYFVNNKLGTELHLFDHNDLLPKLYENQLTTNDKVSQKITSKGIFQRYATSIALLSPGLVTHQHEIISSVEHNYDDKGRYPGNISHDYVKQSQHYHNKITTIPQSQQIMPTILTKQPQHGCHSAHIANRNTVRFPWARQQISSPLPQQTPINGSLSGFQFNFARNDEVLVSYLYGNINDPIICERVHSGVHRPYYQQKYYPIGIVSQFGNKFLFQKQAKQVNILLQAQHNLVFSIKSNYQSMINTKQTMQIQQGNQKILINNGSYQQQAISHAIKTPQASIVVCNNSIKFKAKKIQLLCSGVSSKQSVATKTDLHPCPLHQQSATISQGSSNVVMNGLACARQSDKIDCLAPAYIRTGCQNILVNNKPLARQFDKTTHNASLKSQQQAITVGCLEKISSPQPIIANIGKYNHLLIIHWHYINEKTKGLNGHFIDQHSLLQTNPSYAEEQILSEASNHFYGLTEQQLQGKLFIALQ